MFLGSNISLAQMALVTARGGGGGASWDDFEYLFNTYDGTNANLAVSRHLVTANGNTALTTTTSKFGDSCLNAPGLATSDHITVGDGSGIDLSNEDFALEIWGFNQNAASAAGNLMAKRGAASQISFSLLHSGGLLYFYYTTNGSSFIAATFTLASLPQNEWHKITVARDGVNLRAYLDENQIGSTYNIGTSTIYVSTSPLTVGGDSHNSTVFKGGLDECRISVGTNRGFTGTTIAEQTAIYEKDKYTKFLCHFEGTAASIRIIDEALPSYNNGSGVETDANAVPGLVYDTSGNEEDFTVNGAPIYTGVDDILTFDGVDDYVANATVSQGQPCTSTCKVRTPASAPAVDGLVMGTSTIKLTYDTDHKLTLDVGGVSATTTATYEDQDATLALELTDGAQKVYVNGVEKLSLTEANPTYTGFKFGAIDATTNEWNGQYMVSPVLRAGAYDASFNTLVNSVS